MESTDKVKVEKSQLENQISIIRKAHKEQIQEIRDQAKSEIQKCSSHVNEVNNQEQAKQIYLKLLDKYKALQIELNSAQAHISKLKTENQSQKDTITQLSQERITLQTKLKNEITKYQEREFTATEKDRLAATECKKIIYAQQNQIKYLTEKSQIFGETISNIADEEFRQRIKEILQSDCDTEQLYDVIFKLSNKNQQLMNKLDRIEKQRL